MRFSPKFITRSRTRGLRTSPLRRYADFALAFSEVRVAASPRSRRLAGVFALPLLVSIAFGLGRLARPDECGHYGRAQLAPLAIGFGASLEVGGAFQSLEGLRGGRGDLAPLEAPEFRVVPAHLAMVRHGGMLRPFAREAREPTLVPADRSPARLVFAALG